LEFEFESPEVRRRGAAMSRKRWVIPLAVVLVVVAVVVILSIPRGGAKEKLYRTEAVQRGDVRVTVSATGTLNAVTTVQVGSQVSGTIAALNVDFNDRVKKGQVLAQLDPTFLKAAVAQSEADLEKTRVTQRQAERDYARQTPLREQGLASQSDLDAAETALEAARASVKSSQAALERAQTNLQYATILSPIDGIVISRDVDVGQTVAASLSAPTLFTIANDLSRMQLEASVDEADIGQVKVDQDVSFTVDAFPDRSFHGVVQQIRLAPQISANVVTYTVIVRVENPELRLLPGMTANATFLVAEETNVLKVPVAALRFHPAGRRGVAASSGGASPSSSAAGGWHGNGAAGPHGAGVFVVGSGERLHRIRVTPGISDGMFTAVTADSLAEGAEVVVGLGAGAAASAASQGTVNPFMPGGPPRGRR
jgi:HlyD family secretion protein